ncbi:MAG: DMT family transporter [Thermoplasmata archaeon]
MKPQPGPGTLWPLLGVLVTIWGLNYLFVTVGLTGSGPLWLATLRSGIGLAGMVILVTAARGWTVFDLRAKRDALLLGIPNTALFFGLWFLAARSVPPGIASVVIYTFPLWVALLSAPVLGRPLPAVAWASVALGFVGVALIAQFWSLAGVSVPVVAIVELGAASVSWAFGTVLFQRRFRSPEILPASAFQLAGGFAALLGASVVLAPSSLPTPTWDVIASALWLGLAGTAVGYAIWFTLLDRTPAAQISAYLFLVPVVALTASAVFFGERLSLLQAVGVGCVLVAIYGIGRAYLQPWPHRDPPARPGPGPPRQGETASRGSGGS